MVNDLIANHGLRIIEQITSGHRCKQIYRVSDHTGNRLIIKAAEDDEGKEEIRKNLEGYRKLASLGLQYLTPRIISCSLSDTSGHILMEDCGTDFASELARGNEVASRYGYFESELAKAYRISLSEGMDSNNHIDSQVQTAQTLYRSIFQDDMGSSDLDDAVSGLREYLPQHVAKFCFSSWDFMPGNIFFSRTGLKFADPTELVTGVPIIDLACLSGALIDVYHFPQSPQWFRRLKRFSLGPVAEILCLREGEAEQVYLLGRLVQTLLSLRATSPHNLASKASLANRVQRYVKQLSAPKG